MYSKKKIILIIVISLIIAVGALFAVALFDVYGVTGSDKKIKITVEENETVSAILSELTDKKIILNETLFKAYLKITGKSPIISYGEYTVSADMSYDEILKALEGFVEKPSIVVRIPENANITKIAAVLEEKGICSAVDFIKACQGNEYEFTLKDALSDSYKVKYKLEGYIYPETYYFYENDDPVRVLNVMLDKTESVFGEKEIKRAEELGLTVNEVFTFASIIEGESCGRTAEMPKVAAVFWNRLNSWGRDAYLQSDVTGNYPFNTEYYNSYTNPGLPPGPINCVTKEALNAVLYPDESCSAFFFVTDVDMNFYYNDTLAQHDATIARLKQQGKWA